MRKVDEQLYFAVRNRESRSICGNTVTMLLHDGSGEVFMVCLHGNLIAHIRDGVLTVSNCGWHTRTTAARLNAIFEACGLPYYIRTRDYTHQLMQRNYNASSDGEPTIEIAHFDKCRINLHTGRITD